MAQDMCSASMGILSQNKSLLVNMFYFRFRKLPMPKLSWSFNKTDPVWEYCFLVDWLTSLHLPEGHRMAEGFSRWWNLFHRRWRFLAS